MPKTNTAQLLRELARAADRGEFTEVLVLTGRDGRMTGGATAAHPKTEFARAARTVMDTCGAVAHGDYPTALPS